MGCEELTGTTGSLSCTSDCLLDLSGCVSSGACGNGVAEAGEECDGTDLGSATCATVRSGIYGGGELSCREDCTFDTTGCVPADHCGNARLESEFGEACDGTDLGSETCVGHGYAGGELSCNVDCTLDLSGCIAGGTCGNGTAEADEDCDGTDLKGASCESLGFVSGTAGCLGTCEYDVSHCTMCGNGVVDGIGEECDGTDLAGATCASLGHAGGSLVCGTDCRYSEVSCLPPGTEVWRSDPADYIYGVAVDSAGKLYFSDGAPQHVLSYAPDHTVRWISRQEGNPTWSSSQVGVWETAGLVFAAIAYSGGGLCAFHEETGDTAWCSETYGDAKNSPVLLGDRLAFGTVGPKGVSFLDAQGGELRLGLDGTGPLFGWLGWGSTWFGYDTDAGALLAVDSRSATILWTTALDGLRPWELAVVDPGRARLYILPAEGTELLALDARTGAQVWSCHFDPTLTEAYPRMIVPGLALTSAGELLFVRSGRLYRVVDSGQTCQLLGSFPVDPIVWGYVIVGATGKIYVSGTGSGPTFAQYVAGYLPDGTELWMVQVQAAPPLNGCNLSPVYVAMAPDGTLYVPETSCGSPRIHAYATRSGGLDSGPCPTPFCSPQKTGNVLR